MYITDEVEIVECEPFEAETVGMYPGYRQTIKIKSKFTDSILFNALPSCNHLIETNLSGGIHCKRCDGWYCA